MGKIRLVTLSLLTTKFTARRSLNQTNRNEIFTTKVAKFTKFGAKVLIFRVSFVVFALLSFRVFTARANSNDYQTISVQKGIHRGDAEYAEKRILSNSELCDLCVPLR